MLIFVQFMPKSVDIIVEPVSIYSESFTKPFFEPGDLKQHLIGTLETYHKMSSTNWSTKKEVVCMRESIDQF